MHKWNEFTSPLTLLPSPSQLPPPELVLYLPKKSPIHSPNCSAFLFLRTPSVVLPPHLSVSACIYGGVWARFLEPYWKTTAHNGFFLKWALSPLKTLGTYYYAPYNLLLKSQYTVQPGQPITTANNFQGTSESSAKKKKKIHKFTKSPWSHPLNFCHHSNPSSPSSNLLLLRSGLNIVWISCM